MQKALIVAVTLLLLPLTPPAVLAQEVEPALQQAMDMRDAARVGGDSAEWGRYTTDDFLVTNAEGVVSTKVQRMASIDRNIATEALTSTEIVVRTYGDDTAIVTSRDSLSRRFTNVWIMSDGHWLNAAVHISTIAEP